MTKEFSTSHVKAATNRPAANPAFGLFHSLARGVSSLVVHFLIFIIRLYRWTISPLLPFLFGPSGGCRFTPTCSEYAMDAIRSRGVLAGGWLAIKRIGRCHPWGGCGHDPVADKKFGVRNSNFGT